MRTSIAHYKTVVIFIAMTMMAISCINDLDTSPIDPNTIVSGTVADDPDALVETLAKLYASFAVPGQDGTDGSPDITGIDPGFGVYTRALWCLQVLSTDEAVCAWDDQTIKDMHWQTWTSTDVFIAAMYSRIIYTVSICNEFIRNTATSTDATVVQYNAEARFLRALAYYHAIDLFGNPAFITEEDKPGSFFPVQTTRAELFDYVETELLAIENKLGDPRFEYGRADKAAAWMLLSHLYLNANVYTGTDRYADVITYSGKVIGAGYTLEENYQQNFATDNDKSKEMIFAINFDAQYTRSYGGTTYIIQAASGGQNFGTGMGGWGGNRTTREFMHILVDTLKYPALGTDYRFERVPDKRVFLQLMDNTNITNVGTFGEGIGVRKFTNLTVTGGAPRIPHNDFVCTDYPIFRLADAHLMRAEALLRTNGDRSQALSDVNTIRERAYGNSLGNITNAELTLDYILDERARELYWEGSRRTDLIRYDEFTTAAYLWQWKGNTYSGKATESFRNLYPIPASEVAANPNIKQNTGYN